MLVDDRLSALRIHAAHATTLPAFELAGPRNKIFFDPRTVGCGIVTCGGLCPGINNVVRGIVLELVRGYGVKQILGFRYGYEGLISRFGHEPLALTAASVAHIHHQGGTMLGSSRGSQDAGEMVDHLEAHGIGILFVIGGDGTIRGAMRLTRGDRAPRPEDRRGRRAQDHRQRHPLHRSQLRLRERLLCGGRGRSGARTSRRWGRATASGW